MRILTEKDAEGFTRMIATNARILDERGWRTYDLRLTIYDLRFTIYEDISHECTNFGRKKEWDADFNRKGRGRIYADVSHECSNFGRKKGWDADDDFLLAINTLLHSPVEVTKNQQKRITTYKFMRLIYFF